MYRKIPDETVRRLPVYLRELLRSSEEGHQHISSQNLADCLSVNSCQIRKDFSYFGDFGTRGVGYNVKKLVKQISKVLRLDVSHKAALVWVGNLGSSVLAYSGFKTYGFDIVAAFDIDPRKVGKKRRISRLRMFRNFSHWKNETSTLGFWQCPSKLPSKWQRLSLKLV